jgi:SAM-dependent methyltransferase
LLLCPVDLWRYHEFRAVQTAYRDEPEILDIGSPKLLALYLARRYGVPIVSTDIVAGVGEECALYERTAWQHAITARQCDARDLPFSASSYAFLYSVSVLEHIAEDGDSRAIREIARVLTPGGRAVVTLPLVPEYHERWVDADPYGQQDRNADGRVFFSRYYDWPSLEERIIRPSELTLIHVSAWQERRPGWYDRYCQRTAKSASPISILTKLLDPFWSSRRLVAVDETPPQVTGHGLLALTFEKPGK